MLTGLSVFWFGRSGDIVRNHLVSTDVPEEVRGRALVVEKVDIFPVECVVRGYLSGSGWREYQAQGSVCGIELPPGLRGVRPPAGADLHPGHQGRARGARREHRLRAAPPRSVGDRGLMEELRRLSLELYGFAAEHAERNGIILADTKFEFGRAANGDIVLADEVLTPDSSRFWPADLYRPGSSQPSFDKQYVRDWLDSSGWDHTPPGPELPAEVVENTRAKYVDAYERITQEPFQRWLEAR